MMTMDRLSAALLVAGICLSVTRNGQARVSTVLTQPGRCPDPWLRSPSCPPGVSQCRTDEECPGQQRCCHNGCYSACNDTIKGPEKPGKCPSVRVSLEMCPFVAVERCLEDVDCPGPLKCCHAGCAHACVVPVKEKLGSCPKASSRPKCTDGFEFKCRNDASCPEELKCCNHGCGTSCVLPVT